MINFEVKRTKVKVTARLWSDKHFGAFSQFLRTALTYFNETYHNYSLPGSHDNDDIFKVTDLKVKVTAK